MKRPPGALVAVVGPASTRVNATTAAAWLIGVALPTALMLVAQLLAFWSSALLALLLAVAVLYLTMGFRQFSHHYTAIHVALNAGKSARRGNCCISGEVSRPTVSVSSDVARLAIEEALVASHRHVFAPLILFALFGPAGAVLYRLARHFARAWGTDTGMAADSFGEFSRRTFAVIDWLPVRMTAASFAIVGNFEDAVFCWRTQASRWREEASGILLASGAGALGVRLGMPVGVDDRFGDRPELGQGSDCPGRRRFQASHFRDGRQLHSDRIPLCLCRSCRDHSGRHEHGFGGLRGQPPVRFGAAGHRQFGAGDHDG
ncbi:MAG: regulatory signaling modulator protein AmpE [Rhodocyclaceae bacterium]|nr:regulatory signaling modulator protein AmpE [Rhodocyclaceae bacterium]